MRLTPRQVYALIDERDEFFCHSKQRTGPDEYVSFSQLAWSWLELTNRLEQLEAQNKSLLNQLTQGKLTHAQAELQQTSA